MKNAKSPLPKNAQVNVPLLVLVAVRKWGLIAAVLGMILAAGGVALVMKFWEPVYDAKQFVRVIENGDFEIGDKQSQKTDPQSVLAPIKSEYLLERLLMKKELKEFRNRPDLDVASLREKIRFENAGGELFAIVCRDGSPDFAAKVAQTLTSNFVTYHQEVRDQRLNELREKLAEEIQDAQMDIQRIQGELADKSAKRQAANPEGKKPSEQDGSFLSNLLNGRFVEANNLRNLKDEILQMQKRYDSIADQFDESSILAEVNKDPTIVELDRKLRFNNDELLKLSRMGSSHPRISSLKAAISRHEKERDTRYQEVVEILRKGWVLKNQQAMMDKIKEIETVASKSERALSSFEKEIDEIMDQLDSTSRLDFEFSQKIKEEERAYQMLDNWVAERNRIESKDMSLYHVAVVGDEDVSVPSKAVEQYPTKLIGLALLAGLGIPFALAVLIELRLQRIGNSEQVRMNVPVQLLGEIADLPVRTSNPSRLGSKRLTKQLRLYEESVDNLSAVLVHMDDNPQRAFSVSSAASNEGKTTLSLQLAVSSARSNLGRTLLIDADLRSPSLHRLLDNELDNGLCDVLSGTMDFQDAIKETGIDNLDMLTAGRLNTNPRRYFSNESWAALLHEARKHYDQIIVDTPPVLAASESLAISKECDYTLLCMLRDVSRADSVKRAHARLIAANVKVVGTAFSGVPQHEYANKYGSYEYNM